MQINYHKDTDSLYIHLLERPSVESEEIAPNFVVDFSEEGNIVGIEIDLASRVVDLQTLVSNLPFESKPGKHTKSRRSSIKKRASD